MMEIKGWKFYNNAAIPNNSPHEEVNIKPIETGEIWSLDKKRVLLARWTTDFDCGYETEFWYEIKDTPFDISQLNSKRRYTIKKGIKYFDVKIIEPVEYADELLKVQKAAISAYPKKYKPIIDDEKFRKDISTWGDLIVYGAFFRETSELCGYSLLTPKGRCIDFTVQKTDPKFEKYEINAALVNKFLVDFTEFISNGGYICDGSRNISHETAFQNYLEKYFGFRKAYCKLYIKYRWWVKLIVRSLYPFRMILKKIDSNKVIHNLNGVLKLEEIARSF